MLVPLFPTGRGRQHQLVQRPTQDLRSLMTPGLAILKATLTSTTTLRLTKASMKTSQRTRTKRTLGPAPLPRTCRSSKPRDTHSSGKHAVLTTAGTAAMTTTMTMTVTVMMMMIMVTSDTDNE